MPVTRRQVMAERARILRRNMTRCEKKLWYRFLCRHDPPFRAQKVIGNYIVDFYCRKVRLSIEIDGGQHFTEAGKEYDSRRTLFLEIQEIKELRFTNGEVLHHFEAVCEIIEDEVRKRRHDVRSADFDKLVNKK